MNMTRIKPLVAAAVSACALLAVGVSPAFGAVTWTSTGSIGATGTITIKHNGANAKTCTASAAGTASNSSGYATADLFQGAFPGYMSLPCSGSTTLRLVFWGAEGIGSPGDYYLVLPYGAMTNTPYGTMSQDGTLPFVNGAGAVKSTIVLSDTLLGNTATGAVTATGTLTLSNGSTGTRTLTGSS
jgi:hypothetical protein